MKKHQKLVAILAAVLMIAMSLSACAKAPAATTEEPAAAAATEAPAVEATEAPAARGIPWRNRKDSEYAQARCPR